MWQVQDPQCQPNSWRLKVGVQGATLLLYPTANQSEPNDNYSNYSVSAARGECEEGRVQKVNITFTIYVSDNINTDEYIFCEIISPIPDTNRSEVHLILTRTTTATVGTVYTSTSTVTSELSGSGSTEFISSTTTDSSHGQSPKCLHYLLLLCTLLVFSVLSLQ